MKLQNENKAYRAATRDVRELKGMIAKPAKPVSVEEMSRAVRQLAVRRLVGRR